MQRYIQGVMRVLLYKFTNSLRVKNATVETLSSAFSDVAGQRTLASFTLSMAVFHVTVDDTDHASRRAGLLLSHRFSLSLLSTITAPSPSPNPPYFTWPPYTSSFPASVFLQPFSPLLYMPIICPYSRCVGLYCIISSYIGFATRDDVMHIRLPRMTL